MQPLVCLNLPTMFTFKKYHTDGQLETIWAQSSKEMTFYLRKSAKFYVR